MKQTFFAHSIDGKPVDEWHPLDKHLKDVADLAKKFADEFGSGDWGYRAGLWHDLGKYSEQFQQRFHDGKRVDHATAGAKYACKKLPDDKAKLLAYIIAGHHSGLPDGKSNEESCLTKRLVKNFRERINNS